MDPIRSPTEYQTVSLAQKNRQAPFPSGIHFSGVRCRGTIRSIACCSIPLLSIYLFTPHPLILLRPFPYFGSSTTTPTFSLRSISNNVSDKHTKKQTFRQDFFAFKLTKQNLERNEKMGQRPEEETKKGKRRKDGENDHKLFLTARQLHIINLWTTRGSSVFPTTRRP